MLKSEIVGSVKMKCYLSGMPELRLGLNDKILFENTGSKYYDSWNIRFLIRNKLSAFSLDVSCHFVESNPLNVSYI